MLVSLMGDIYEYVIEMGSGAMTYIRDFIKLGGYRYRHTDSKMISQAYFIFFFFKIRKVSQK
jgi:hypothetical protein